MYIRSSREKKRCYLKDSALAFQETARDEYIGIRSVQFGSRTERHSQETCEKKSKRLP
jgi:hypothetical protein